MKKYSTKLKYEFAQALHQIIERALEQLEPERDDDRLFMAALAEVKHCLYKKLENWRVAYQIRFSPVQAQSLRMLFLEYSDTLCNPYTANRLRQIADEIHQHYS